MLLFSLLLLSSDPDFAQQPNLTLIHAPEAWQTTLGDESQRIGIVDTGLIRSHEDIAAKDAGGYDFITDKNASGDGDGRDADYTDDGLDGPRSHGSHVAGILAAPGDNGKGIAGINWKAKVVSARALTALGGGNSIDIMDGALWLAGVHVDGVPDIDAPVDVINMSIGIPGPCDAHTQDQVDQILARGVAIIAATGNHGPDFGGVTDATVQSPANCKGAIAVGAVDFDKVQTDYTNADGRIDIVAPGGTHALGILSLGASPTDYQPQQGTSMATPHVAGVVSLMLAVDPSLSPARIAEILKALPSTCTGCHGVAMLDAEQAVAAVKAGAGPLGGATGGCGAAPASPGALGAVLLGLRLFRRRRR